MTAHYRGWHIHTAFDTRARLVTVRCTPPDGGDCPLGILGFSSETAARQFVLDFIDHLERSSALSHRRSGANSFE